MKNYCLNNVDSELWKEFKTACAYFDQSIRQTFITHIVFVIGDYKRARKRSDKPTVYTKKRGKK